MPTVKKTALDFAKDAKEKEEEERKKQEAEDQITVEREKKYVKSLERKIAGVFNQFCTIRGFTVKRIGTSYPKRYFLFKGKKQIAVAFVGFKTWENPNYDYKVIESGNVIIWQMNKKLETYSHGYRFEQEFGYAMKDYI